MYELLEKLLKEDKYKLFHVSSKYLGREVTLNPRIPEYAEESMEDSTTPRVSLASIVEEAIGAADVLGEVDKFYVYELINKPKLVYPTEEQVPDVKQTGEVWAVTPAKLRYIKRVDSFGHLG